jgi:hypothetical protein
MIEQAWQKRMLRVARERRDMPKAGWEFVGEGGGKLWELERGWRIKHEIRDVKISACGKGVWVKIEQRPAGDW